MSALPTVRFTRRAALQGAGALIVSFTLPLRIAVSADGRVASEANVPASGLAGSLAKDPHLDAWIRVDADGQVTAFTGKVEFGQGLKTALLQVVAEELEVPIGQIQLVTADTTLTVDEGYTAGSHSMQDSGAALRNAAAQVREILLAEASRRLQLPVAQLRAEDGAVVTQSDVRVPYGELVAANLLHVEARPDSRLKDPASFKVMDRSVPRIDIPAKVTGGAAFVQDMRLQGMLHARVIRPPSYDARLTSVDLSGVAALPGVLKVLHDGSFLAVVAEREFQAVRAMRALSAAARWQEHATLPSQERLTESLLAQPSRDQILFDQPAAENRNPPVTTGPSALLEATYTRPYIAHGSIGPSCAIAHWTQGVMTIWTHTQGVYPDRQAIAEMLSLPAEKIRCIHVEGSGCYGHNGADDAAADAALIAASLPDRPIRVQWTRQQEHAWEPFGPAMAVRVLGRVNSSGVIEHWDYAVWSNTHSMRPGPAGSLLAARHSARAFVEPEPRPLPMPEGGGDRNALPLYRLAAGRVVHHFLPRMPLRVSALRSLGAHMNVFAIESFMDELALAADADPVAFRLRHLDDPRARDVVATAADRFGWSSRETGSGGRGNGIAFARYKNLAAYCAVAMQVEVSRDTGRTRVMRVVAAVDTGQVINPDGVRNQIEGGILQSISWTLFESVRFDSTRITSVDWSSYPILRFDDVPEAVSVHVLDRPGLPFLGCGEAAQGPAAAALANAVANATGHRLRDLPLTAARVRSVIGP